MKELKDIATELAMEVTLRRLELDSQRKRGSGPAAKLRCDRLITEINLLDEARWTLQRGDS